MEPDASPSAIKVVVVVLLLLLLLVVIRFAKKFSKALLIRNRSQLDFALYDVGWWLRPRPHWGTLQRSDV